MLLERHANDEILFSDEKLFVLEPSHNAQNDRMYAACLQDIPYEKLGVPRSQSAQSVMVWGAVTKRGKLPLLFIEKGVKINKDYYLQNVLKNHLLKYSATLFKNDHFVFLQDSAPAHKAKVVQQWCVANLPGFISSKEWPASSPDLNALDYSIWGYMLQQLTNLKPISLEKFKLLLERIWNEMPDDYIRAACEVFPKRLLLVIKNKGQPIELK